MSRFYVQPTERGCPSQLFAALARDADELAATLAIGRCMMTGLLVHDGLIGDKAQMARVLDQWVEMVQRR